MAGKHREIKCSVCEKVFVTHNYFSLFCSVKCRRVDNAKWARMQKSKKKLEIK